MSIRKLLQVPHFSNTKRLDLVYQKQIPIIYGQMVKPIVVCQFLFTQEEYKNESCSRFYTGRCQRCLDEDMRYDQKLDIMICMYCGLTSTCTEVFNYVRSNRRKNMCRKFSVDFDKRVVHFRYWLRRLQGKEKNNVTKEIIDQVKTHLRRTNTNAIHYWTVRNALRTLGLQKYYYNTVSIMANIRGRPLFNLTRKHEGELINMFMQLQDVFSHLQNKRVNMLSYPYVIRQLCELKGWKHMAKIIPTLKSHNRIVTQNSLWKYICKVKHWPFIPMAPWSSQETRPLDGKPR